MLKKKKPLWTKQIQMEKQPYKNEQSVHDKITLEYI